MTNFTVLTKNFIIQPELKNKINEQITTDMEKLPPGAIIKKGEWYGLTYLKTIFYDNFIPQIWEYQRKEVDTIKVTMFRQYENKLLIMGNKRDLSQIENILQAAAITINQKPEINFGDFYLINDTTIDFNNIIKKLEDSGDLENIKKLKLDKLEVTVGQINNCTINTDDYGGVKKIIEDPNESVAGIEITFKSKPKTSVYIDKQGKIRTSTKNKDVDVEALCYSIIDIL